MESDVEVGNLRDPNNSIDDTSSALLRVFQSQV